MCKMQVILGPFPVEVKSTVQNQTACHFRLCLFRIFLALHIFNAAYFYIIRQQFLKTHSRNVDLNLELSKNWVLFPK
jgi:hypothetical protein